jgi:hypothetical protein
VGIVSYIQESGDPRPGDRSSWNTLVALCLPEEASDDLSQSLRVAVQTAFPNVVPEHYEIKAARLLAQRRYEHSPQRRRLVSELTSVLQSLPVSVFAVRARRPAEYPAWPPRRLDPRYRLLVQRIELHMRRDFSRDFAKLTFDQSDVGNDADRSRSIRTFMRATDEGRSWKHVLDVPFFVSPSVAPGIQLADFLAGTLRLNQLLQDTGVPSSSEWGSAVRRLADLAAAKSHDFRVGGETHRGLYTMPDTYYAQPPALRAF